MKIIIQAILLIVFIGFSSAACDQSRQTDSNQTQSVSNSNQTQPVSNSNRTQSVSNQSSAKLDFDTLIYSYAPVAGYTTVAVEPKSFRRKTFTVGKEQVKIVIDDKDGKIVEQSTAKPTKEEFDRIIEAVNSGNFKKNKNISDSRCPPGGYFEKLILLKGKKQILKGTVRSCKESGTLTGETDALRAALKALFPDVEGLRYFGFVSGLERLIQTTNLQAQNIYLRDLEG